MSGVVRRLSPSAELVLINLICFGPFATMSIVGLVERNTMLVFDNRRALTTLGIELVCGALAMLLLRARGWKLADLGLRITMPQVLAGMLLLFGANLVIAGFAELVQLVTGIDVAAVTSSEARVTWPVLIALTLINPLYDEIFSVAYNVEAAKNHGAAFAITLSAAIRFLCHLEQGPISAVTILPLGLIFAFVYWRWRVVWPLVVAHGVMDFLGLMPR
jgi:membrane protease YdiL (CAAX protease family)